MRASEDGGNEICRLDSSAETLLMASGHKVEFGSTNNFIVAGTSLTGSSAADVYFDAGANLVFDADGGEVAFKDGGTTQFEILFDSSTVDLEAKVSNESLRLRVNDGGTERTLIELDPSSAVGSNADIVIGHVGMAAGEIALIPKVDNVVDLGGASNRFRNIYTGDLNLQNDRGNWTLIEESGFISFRNNDTGKRYKMLMEEITGDGSYGPGNDGVL